MRLIPDSEWKEECYGMGSNRIPFFAGEPRTGRLTERLKTDEKYENLE